LEKGVGATEVDQVTPPGWADNGDVGDTIIHMQSVGSLHLLQKTAPERLSILTRSPGRRRS